MISSVRDIISQWPTRQAFADAVGKPIALVHKWAQHNAIPAWHQAGVLRACDANSIPVTAEMLIAMHDDKRCRERETAE